LHPRRRRRRRRLSVTLMDRADYRVSEALFDGSGVKAIAVL